MAKDPAFLFYSSDFLTGVTDLTMEERGQYITLMCLQHQKGRLSEKTIRLSVGNVSVDVLYKLTKDENGFYYSERLEKVIEERRSFIESRRENGLKGGRPKNKPNGLAYAKPNENLPENENENEVLNTEKDEKYTFVSFWNMYDKKVDKGACQKKWVKLKEVEKEKIMNVLPVYVQNTPDIKYRKHPKTWLNNKCWEDEILQQPKENKSIHQQRPQDQW